jgi:hypothetical protein
MELTIDLPPEMLQRLEEEAARNGRTVSEQLQSVLERSLSGPRWKSSKKRASTDFLAGIPRGTPEDAIALAEAQGVKPVEQLEDLMGDFWPEDESVDEFLEARKRWHLEAGPDFPEDEAKRKKRRRPLA